MFKRMFTLMALITAVVLWTGCAKDANHMVRVQNNYKEDMKVVKIDAINYGSIKSGGVSEYKQVAPGDFTMSGSTASGVPFSGSGTLKGQGTHHWTMTITASGGVSFNEDK
jgi:hypothetical protein